MTFHSLHTRVSCARKKRFLLYAANRSGRCVCAFGEVKKVCGASAYAGDAEGDDGSEADDEEEEGKYVA